MYKISAPLDKVAGVGPVLKEKLVANNLYTVGDLLLDLPLGYADFSQTVEVADLEIDQPATIQAELSGIRSFYKGRRSIQQATAHDGSGKVKLFWFNTPFIAKSLKTGVLYRISGQLNAKGTIVHPQVEAANNQTLHTGRIVPRYSLKTGIQQGKLRRLLQHILQGVEIEDARDLPNLPPLSDALNQLHFPDSEDGVKLGLKRLAIEELIALILHARQSKHDWQLQSTAPQIKIGSERDLVPSSVPYQLTNAQLRSLTEIMADLAEPTPMNRLLVGDVGSGKTVVAGSAIYHCLQTGQSAALVAPTQILAEQHFETLRQLFPSLTLELVARGSARKKTPPSNNPTVYVGTHAILNRLEKLQPALIIIDEQHRFGVKQRATRHSQYQPHILTMSATPIPRTYALTIFSHLDISTIDELPAGRQPTKTWYTPEQKRSGAYSWLSQQLQSDPTGTAIIVCPFIQPSAHESLENVKAAEELYTELQKNPLLSELNLGLLHGKMKKPDQQKVAEQLRKNEIRILVATPIVEVGLDLPTASIIIIEAAERFGFASLHQLRGRVGRAGQQGYCLVISSSKSDISKKRLQEFAKISNGFELAEKDLTRRGAGDIFGANQHGFDQLRFADWADVEIIKQARDIADRLDFTTWQPALPQLAPRTKLATPN